MNSSGLRLKCALAGADEAYLVTTRCEDVSVPVLEA